MKILIAEDQPASAVFLRRTLERMGHEVAVAPDGEAAWQALRDDHAQVLISDWVMPRLDGLELCRRIRDEDGDGYTYVILLTSKDRREERLEGLRAGADDFLTKPVDADELAVRLGIASRILTVHEALASRNARLAELAMVDELTGVKNRRRFREDLDLFFALASRRKIPLSLVMLDVDHFKQYNDAFGHPAGDEVLRIVAGLLLDVTREHDVVSRYGGEEFAILLPSTGSDSAVAVAERFRERIERHPWPHRAVTASLGVASTGADTPTSASLVETADRALYCSKGSGRNRVSYQGMETDAPAREQEPAAT
jgi:two-component system cell cycle response regulator